MNINSNFPSVHISPAISRTPNNDPVDHEKIIHGRGQTPSPLAKSIVNRNFQQFTALINIVGTDCLRVPLQRGQYRGITPVSLMLNTVDIEFIGKAIELFGKDILWETVSVESLDLSMQLPGIYGTNIKNYLIPFVHYAFCDKKTPSQVFDFLLEHLSAQALKTTILGGLFQGLTPVHLAFILSNPQAVTWLTNQPSWDDVNIPIKPDSLCSQYLPDYMKVILSMPPQKQSFILLSKELENFPRPHTEELFRGLDSNDKTLFKNSIETLVRMSPRQYFHSLYEVLEPRILARKGDFGSWVKKYVHIQSGKSLHIFYDSMRHPLMQISSLQSFDGFVQKYGILGLTLPVSLGFFAGMHALHFAALFSSFSKFEYLCNQLDELEDCLHPINIGSCQGLTIVHLAAIGADIRNLKFLVEKLGEDCLHQPAQFGPHKGKKAIDLASDLNPEKFHQFLSGAELETLEPQPIEPAAFITSNAQTIPAPSPPPRPAPTPAPAPIPQPIPNPIEFNMMQWVSQKLAFLKQNPLRLIDEFKDSGMFDYSVYGETFITPKGPSAFYPIGRLSPSEASRRVCEEIKAHKSSEEVLDDVAGAAYQLHMSCLQQMIHKPRDTKKTPILLVPFLVYTQQGHEVRAHIVTAMINQVLLGLDDRRSDVAVNNVKQILGDSSYRFEEGQIVMDLEGFEKLTQEMAKPGFSLIIMPKMPDPEPVEEQPRRVMPVQSPRPTATPVIAESGEPTSMKRTLPADSHPAKRVRMDKSAPVSDGVDRRTALTDGAKTTRTREEERVSSSAKRQKQGKFENIPMGKTVEMPGITLDEGDPLFFLKKLIKSSLEGTLNNLKTANARSALIRREPLPMPIADKLAEIVPAEEVRTLTELKGYQFDALKNIMTLSTQGVMPLLSLEMGLGKTYVFREWILQRIIAHKGGRHLIIVPASVKEQTQNVFQDCLRKLVQEIREICRGLAPNDTGFSPEQLSSILRFPPSSVIMPNKKEMKDALQKDHAILIVNYEILAAMKGCFGYNQLTSIVADEAQRVHNDQSQTQNHLAELIKAQTQETFRLLQVTATPYENDLTELWTLLSSSNPGLVPAESQKALITGLQKIKENLVDSIQGKEIDTELLITQFAHYKAFQQLLGRLVIYKKTTDPQVVQDWNGRIPTKTDENPEVELDPEVLQALADATQRLIADKNHLSFNARSNAALIHTSLIDQSIQDGSTAVQQLYRDAEEGDFASLVEKSAFLKLLFGGANPVLKRCYDQNMKALVFVDHYATGKLIQIGAQKIYGRKVEFFNGQCSPEDKSRLTTWFEKTKEPRVLVLSMKAGGVGLNLPSARLVVDLSQEYNIAQHYQAIARAIRANNEGEIQVLRPLFKGSFYQAHVSAHQAKKARWMQFFFEEGSFNSFLEAVINETRIDLLNKSKNLPQADEEENKMRTALDFALTNITSDQIEDVVEQVSHIHSAPIAAAPISLDPRSYLQIALPYGTSREDAILFGITFQNNLAKPLVERFKQEKRKIESEVDSNESIRSNPESLYARRVRQLIQFARDNSQAGIVGKDFVFRGDIKSPDYIAADENQMEDGVFLYKKPLPNGEFHYEPLIPKR